jgi:NAD(P)-dependent dehydrogenase (short-subunit alcohol dehydrogenase family)
LEREFSGRVAVVTGASSGIGRATALRLAAGGATVIATARRAERLQQLPNVIPLACDVHEVDTIVDAAVQHGGLDILVNAAGILVAGSIENTSLAAWDETLDVNLRAVFHLISAAAPHLIARRGNVVNVSSVTGLRAFPNILAYCVSKAAIDQLTRCAALELAPKNVRVNAVNPGRCRHRSARQWRDGTRCLRAVSRTQPLDSPTRPRWRRRRDREPDRFSRLRPSRVDYRRYV